MLIGPEHLEGAFTSLADQDKKVALFCATDCDSIAALRILKTLAKNVDLSFRQTIVSTDDQLKAAFFSSVWPKSLKYENKKEKVTNVVMINCGATIDLTDALYPHDFATANGLTEEEVSERFHEINFYVFDYHRPIHLENVREGSANVLLFCDAETCEVQYPKIGDLEALEEEEEQDANGELPDDDEDEDEDNEDEDEDEDDEDDENDPMQPRKRRKSSEEDSPSSHIRHRTEGEPPRKGKKKKLSRDERLLQREERRRERHRRASQLRNRIQSYYRDGSYYGQSSAYLMYQVALRRNHETSELLWCAILGVTDHLVHQRSSRVEYLEFVSALKLEVDARSQRTAAALSSSSSSSSFRRSSSSPRSGSRQRSSSSGRREGEPPLSSIENGTGTAHRRHSGSSSASSSSSKRKMPRSSEITFAPDELNFAFLRHQSLFDSMLYSSHVASSLMLHTERGLKTLGRTLAYLAIPLEEAKLPFKSMRTKHQEHLIKNMRKVKGTLPAKMSTFINGLFFPSFLKQHGQTLPISATDMVLACTALLQEQPDAFQIHLQNELRSQNIQISTQSDAVANVTAGFGGINGLPSSSHHGGGSQQQQKNVRVIEDPMEILAVTKQAYTKFQTKQLYHNFNRAYDAMRINNIDVFLEGLDLAKRTQRAIVRQGQAMLDRSKIQFSGPYRYAELDDGENRHLFTNHRILARLGFFLHDALRIMKMGRRDVNKPLILSCPNDKSNTHVVVGLTGSDMGHFHRNKFGHIFQSVGNTTQSRFSHTLFDTHVIEVQRDDLQKFTDYLHTGLAEVRLGMHDDAMRDI